MVKSKNKQARPLALIVVVGTILALAGGVWQPVSAASPRAPSGISISPILQQIALNDTTSSQQFNVTLSNNTAGSQQFNLTAQNFESLNNSGGINLEGVKTNYSQQYGLVSWLTLGANTLTLQPGESQTVPITIDNRSDLQPGGHYAAIVASTVGVGSQKGGQVAINQQLLSLVLVNKLGGDHYALNLNSASQNGNWLHLPNTVTLNFQNPGNVHVVPRGIVKLLSPGGTVVATGIINSESSFILPDSFRQLYVPLTKVGHAVQWPGVYRLEIDYRYDGISHYATMTQHLEFIDLGLYLLTALVIMVLGWQLEKRRIARKKRHH